MKNKLLVVGSMNMDIVQKVQAFPLPGETIHGGETAFYPGGKGANQAVAAARAGGDCAMVGAVGSDPFADTLIGGLEEQGVQAGLVRKKSGASGIAIITVNGEGENTIVLSPGANGLLSANDALSALPDWSGVYAVLLQNEIPPETTDEVIRAAAAAGVRVYLNPAPARELSNELMAFIDTLIVNETEAAAVSGMRVTDSDSAKKAAERLALMGAGTVIVTLGDKGCICRDGNGGMLEVPAFRASPVDTTAAGDTFIGAYAAAMSRGSGTRESLVFASAAAALAVGKAGAQASIPSEEEIVAFIGLAKTNGISL